MLKNMVIIGDGCETHGDVFIDGKKIVAVGPKLPNMANIIIDGEGRLVVCAGLFDMHVHLRDPGQTYKEDILTASAAAFAGGFTGVACMPNTKPSIDNEKTVRYILDKAKISRLEVVPVGCITKGLEGEELCDYDELIEAGVRAVSDDGRPVNNARIMLEALDASRGNGLLVISHCEDLDIIGNGIINKGEVSRELDVEGMDRASEDSVTAREIALADSVHARIHIAHVSTRGSVALIRDAKARGVRVTCETAPHYFTFTEEKLRTRDADYRMNPPLRTEKDRDAILDGIFDGTIDCIVTDHAPHTLEEKSDFLTAPNGVVGLETSLAAALTQLHHKGKLPIHKIVSMMSSVPREILGLERCMVYKDFPANVTVFDPSAEWTVKQGELHSKSRNTAFKGEKLKGRVIATIVGGEIMYHLYQK